MKQLITRVVGVQFSDYKNLLETIVDEGDSVELWHARTNKHDPRAVEVLLHGIRIGYLPMGSEAQIEAICWRVDSAKLHKYNPVGTPGEMFELALEIRECEERVQVV